MATTFHNSVLNALDTDTLRRLDLRKVNLELNHEIEFPGEPIRHLLFIEEGMASMTTTFLNGSQVEVTMFGLDSIVGVSALMGTRRSLNRIYTQIPGYGYQCDIEAGRREFARCDLFQQLSLAFVQAQLIQAMQSAGCNIKHEVEQRLARWLLICADRAHSDTFLMRHEYLSDMLGCSRPSVSVAAKVLKDKRLISYTRGTIAILDVAGLEAAACECYRNVKNHLENDIEFAVDIVA